MDVEVRTWSPHGGVLAFVGGVRVRVKPRAGRPPTWRCDAHPTKYGRTSCPHIAALAATPADPALRAPARQVTPKETK